MSISDEEFDKCTKELNKHKMKKYYLNDFKNIIQSAFRLGYVYGKSCRQKQERK